MRYNKHRLFIEKVNAQSIAKKIDTPFYCYSYSFGELLVHGLFAKYNEEGKSFVNKYMNLLSSGSTEIPEKLGRKVGIELDKRLLKNFYLSKGYYNVEIVSSSAESKNKNTEIELTYSINAGERYRIKKLSTNIDPVFDSSIFAGLKEEFTSFAGEFYSPFKIQKILKEIFIFSLQFLQKTVILFMAFMVTGKLDVILLDLTIKKLKT